MSTGWGRRGASALVGLVLLLSAACTSEERTTAAQSRPLPVGVPDEGVLIDVAGVATFRSLDGRQQVPLQGFHLAGGIVTGSRTWLAAADGSTWLLDAPARRLVRQDLGHDDVDGLQLLQGLPPAEPRGHWRYALAGPGGTFLAQWSGECEVPEAYAVDRRRHLRLLSPPGKQFEGFARGWTSAGLPVVDFPQAACGEGMAGPGLYTETSPGHYRLIVRASQGAYYRLPAPASTTSVRLCASDDYRMVAVADGATGSVALGAEIHAVTTTPCRLERRITFMLTRSGTDDPLGVRNNGLGVAVRGTLPDDDLHAAAVWGEPYCDPQGVDLVVSDAHGGTSRAAGIMHPRCDPQFQKGLGPGLSPLYSD